MKDDQRKGFRVSSVFLIAMGILAVGLFIRIAVNQQLFEWYPYFLYPSPISDMAIHHNLALEVAQGNIPQPVLYTNPLYYHLLGLWYWLGGDQVSFIGFQNFCGACIGPMIFLIARKFFPVADAALSGLLAAVYQPFVFYDQFLLLESLHNSCFVLLLLAMVYLDLKWILAASVSALMGLLFLFRGNALILWPAIAFYLWKKNIGFRGILLVILLWLPWYLLIPLYNYHFGGILLASPTNFGHNLYVGNSGESTGVLFLSQEFRNLRNEESKIPATGRNAFWKRKTIESWKGEPWNWVFLFLKKICLVWGAWEIPNNVSLQAVEKVSPLLAFRGFPGFGLVASFGLLGLFLSRKFSGQSQAFFQWIVSLLVTWTLGIALFVVLGRYRLPLVSVLCITSGHGLMCFIRKGERKILNLFILAFLVLAIQVMLNFQFFLEIPVHGFPPSLRY